MGCTRRAKYSRHAICAARLQATPRLAPRRFGNISENEKGPWLLGGLSAAHVPGANAIPIGETPHTDTTYEEVDSIK